MNPSHNLLFEPMCVKMKWVFWRDLSLIFFVSLGTFYFLRSWGDPHIITYDHLNYDVQGSGDYILLR